MAARIVARTQRFAEDVKVVARSSAAASYVALIIVSRAHSDYARPDFSSSRSRQAITQLNMPSMSPTMESGAISSVRLLFSSYSIHS